MYKWDERKGDSKALRDKDRRIAGVIVWDSTDSYWQFIMYINNKHTNMDTFKIGDDYKMFPDPDHVLGLFLLRYEG